MATATAHPKNTKKCAFCRKWDGDANLVFKSPQVGFQYDLGKYAKCMKNGSTQPSGGGTVCNYYEPLEKVKALL